MVMLILETFVLMLLSALLGTALGSLLAEAWGSDWATDRPWLREAAPLPPAPGLPAAPQMMSDAERARLTLALTAPHVAAPTPVPVVASAAAPVAAPPSPPVEAAPAAVSTEPTPDPAPAPAPPAPLAEPAPAPAPVAEAPALAEADRARAGEADAHGARPAGLVAPREGTADDLKRIKGIGKQNEARLNALGIWHFDQIAAWSPENIAWAGSFLAFVGRIEREDWVGQAKILAAGGTTEFAARVDAGEVPTSNA
ncbi:hypothetical protein [Pinisolibacter aquiterrae]|uniref:hypothetical protein n=1 Tax=Pinisolibacter aquiterrae TaxID=2815579 RepID=UPI003B75CE53